jgi:hypothetical protein
MPRHKVAGMAWLWRYENSAGETVSPDDAPPGESFPTQADAETWIGETWRTLVDEGAATASLFHDGELVYGPMALTE